MKVNLADLREELTEYQLSYYSRLESYRERNNEVIDKLKREYVRKVIYISDLSVGAVDSAYLAHQSFLSKVLHIIVSVSCIFKDGNVSYGDVGGKFFEDFEERSFILKSLSAFFEISDAFDIYDVVDIVLLDRRLISILISMEQGVVNAVKHSQGIIDKEIINYLTGNYFDVIRNLRVMMEGGRIIFTSKVSNSNTEIINSYRELSFNERMNDYELCYILLDEGEYITTPLDIRDYYIPAILKDNKAAVEEIERIIKMSKEYSVVFLKARGRIYKFESRNPQRDASLIYRSMWYSSTNEFPYLDFTDKEAKAFLSSMNIFISSHR